MPAFQSIISRLSVARRVPEKIEVERSPTVADLVLMVQTAGSQELAQLGNHGARHFSGAVKSARPPSFGPLCQNTVLLLPSLESKFLGAPAEENLHNLN